VRTADHISGSFSIASLHIVIKLMRNGRTRWAYGVLADGRKSGQVYMGRSREAATARVRACMSSTTGQPERVSLRWTADDPRQAQSPQYTHAQTDSMATKVAIAAVLTSHIDPATYRIDSKGKPMD